MTEAELRASIVRALRRLDCFVLDLSAVPNAFPHLKGLADLYVLTPAGRSMWMEVKLPKRGSQNDGQRLFERRVVRRGGEYVLVTSREAAVGVCGL